MRIVVRGLFLLVLAEKLWWVKLHMLRKCANGLQAATRCKGDKRGVTTKGRTGGDDIRFDDEEKKKGDAEVIILWPVKFREQHAARREC